MAFLNFDFTIVVLWLGQSVKK